MTTPPAPVYGGRYELRNQIARGGTAQVYQARDLLLDRPVALKVLFPELSTDHSFVERFRREAQAAANLMHPNIVQVFDWGESDRTYFIVMEYIDGEPLSSIIRTQAPLAPAQAASIAADIAKALSYAHRHGVVHRDVKPGNVLITADGQVKVTDFGIARAIGADEQVTQTGLVMGTATYFSPEQAQGLAVDARSDVYSLGVVCYEMLTGRPPFSGETPVAIAYQHVRESPPTPRAVNPEIPAALEVIVLEAMAKLPAERYASADDMKADLDRFIQGQTVLARPPRIETTGEVTRVLGGVPALADDPSGPDTSVVGVVGRDAPRRPRSTTPWWVSAGVLLLVAIGLVAYFGGRSLGYFGGKTTVAVPVLVGKTRSVAEALVTQQGLHVSESTVQTKASELSRVGRVKSQSPRASTRVRSGSTVKIVVWSTPPSAPVPDVTGTAQQGAISALRAAGFVTQVRYVLARSASEKQGYVVRQQPSSSASRPRGSSVTIYVTAGSRLVSVPTVVGDTVNAATIKLVTAHFVVSQNTTSELSSSVPVGDVVATSPAAGAKVPPGSTISLVVSRGSVPVPDVAGDTLSAAEQTLSQAGLTYRPAIQNNVAPDQIGFVVGTSPVAGTPVAAGRQVVVFVGAMNGSTTTTTTSTTTTTTTFPGVPTTTTFPGTPPTTTFPGTPTTTTLPVPPTSLP
ncbi:MAG: Stk1 family PASTA domain-containing Ser/Thr kinase [Actinomycetota bacterium]|nr:Stk1 family PASTA domain-containing Ser/Thr kinase [Actinomycetota bacterium]